MNTPRRAPSRIVPLPWLLWAAILATALLAAFVHLLTSAVERGETLRRHQAGAGLISSATAATRRDAPETARAGFMPPIPQSHVALIVVP